MRKIELADKLAHRLNIRRDEAFSIISNLVDVMKESLAEGKEVRLTGLGKFSPELRGGTPKRDFFRQGQVDWVCPYIKVRFKQFSSSKYEIFAENKDFWALVAKKENREVDQPKPTAAPVPTPTAPAPSPVSPVSQVLLETKP